MINPKLIATANRLVEAKLPSTVSLYMYKGVDRVRPSEKAIGMVTMYRDPNISTLGINSDNVLKERGYFFTAKGDHNCIYSSSTIVKPLDDHGDLVYSTETPWASNFFDSSIILLSAWRLMMFEITEDNIDYLYDFITNLNENLSVRIDFISRQLFDALTHVAKQSTMSTYPTKNSDSMYVQLNTDVGAMVKEQLDIEAAKEGSPFEVGDLNITGLVFRVRNLNKLEESGIKLLGDIFNYSVYGSPAWIFNIGIEFSELEVLNKILGA